MKKIKNGKNVRIFTATIMTATLLASSSYSLFAASNREAWNNAASSKDTATVLENGNTVYSNVYADAAEWSEWKNQWSDVRNDFEKIALTPGEDETQMNFAWYTKTIESPAIRITDKDGNPTGTTYYGTQGDVPEEVVENEVATKLYPNKVTITGLEENSTYYYQYLKDGKFSDTYSFSTKETEDFSFLYVGDPQIGASTGQTATEDNTFSNSKEYFARNDAFNWTNTLENAVSANPDVSFIMSAGDQINQTKVDAEKDKLEQQVEYAGFLNSSILRSLPIATTIGNHDSKSVNYQNHFNNPNSYTEEVGASVAGNDYYFTYGDALFVVINTNNYNCQTHKDLITKAIEENSDAKWKILMFHQDIYGSGADHSDSDGMILRTQLTSIIDEAGFDAVLQGHDHTYSRTYQISGADGTYTAFTGTGDENFQSENAACYDIVSNAEDSTKVLNPSGTVYFEANSASGSKFYQLIATQQNYIAARNQSWRPTYSVIDIDEVSLTVKTFDAATNEELVADGDVETSYTIVKSVDKTNLSEKVNEAEALVSKTDIYTEDSISKLAQVIEAAKEIINNAEAKTVDVASAYTSVEDAINALEEVKAETTTEDANQNKDENKNNGVENPTNNTNEEKTTTSGKTQIADSTPKTGDSGKWFVVSTISALASAAGLVVLKLKGKDKEVNE